MVKIFENKVAIVTGGSFGIGRATAIKFAKKGANVVVADWVEDPDQFTMKAIVEAGGKGTFIKCDVSKDAEVKAIIVKTISTYGRLDFAFNNAGIEGLSAPTQECTEENWDRVLSVNLKGAWLCMKYEIQEMLKQGKGAIVNTSSVAGLVAFVGIPAYVASKHAILGLTKNAALENVKAGIRVNAVCPGVIQTPMIDRFTGKNKEVEKAFANQEPIGRLGSPEEVAAAVVWLCSDAASFVTGICMPVDGGWVAQ